MAGSTYRSRASSIVLWGLTAFALLVTLFPIYWIFTISTKLPRDAFASPPKFIYRPRFDAYLEIWDTMGDALITSIVVITIAVTLALLVSIPAAYALSRNFVPNGGLLKGWLLAAYMAPQLLFALPMYVLYQQLGLHDTRFGLALMYQVIGLPIAIWLLKSFFDGIPVDLGDAAAVDGAGRAAALLRVYLPLIGPGIGAAAVLLGVYMWNELVFAISLGFNQARTVPVAIAGFRGYAAVDWAQMSAASIVAIVPILIFAGFAQKYIVTGLTTGGVK